MNYSTHLYQLVIIGQQQAIEWMANRTWIDLGEMYFVVMSVVGQHFISERRRTGFYFWFAGNVVAIVVFTILGRIPTTLLYCYFTYKCVSGALNWKRLEQAGDQSLGVLGGKGQPST